MNTRRADTSLTSVIFVFALVTALAAPTRAAESSSGDWRFGIGTGFSSFSLDGDLGFATSAGGLIQDIDLSNSETKDLVQSGFGLGGFARNEQWTILWSAGQQSLEDEDSSIDAKWDRTQAEIAAVYKVATLNANSFGVLFGARYTRHDWDIKTGGAVTVNSPDEDWTDAIIGLTHELTFAERWSWTNRVDYGFGGSDGTTFASTTLNWRPFEHWAFNVSGQFLDTKFGDKSDINKSDFYYYDVKQPQFGVGFAYVW